MEIKVIKMCTKMLAYFEHMSMLGSVIKRFRRVISSLARCQLNSGTNSFGAYAQYTTQTTVRLKHTHQF